MKLGYFLIKTGNILEGICAGGFGIATLYNLTNNNYEAATLTGLASLYFAIEAHSNNKKIKFAHETLPKLKNQMEQIEILDRYQQPKTL